MTNNKIIIGIIGQNAAGKTTATEYLKKKYGGVSFKFSGMLSDVLSRMYLPATRANFQTLSTILREHFGQDLMSKVITEDVKRSTESLIITEGVRRPTDVANLKLLPNCYLIAINTDQKLRYERLLTRGEKPDDAVKTWNEFQYEDEQEPEQKIREVTTQANFQIDNNGSREDLYRQLDALVKKYS